MNRSLLVFGFGAVLLVSPLRLVWARAGAPAWAVFVAWAFLVGAGMWVVRERRG